jgi:hypothetical protein
VLITIAIVTGGLLFITQAYSYCKNMIMRSQASLYASLLAEAAIWPLEESQEAEEGLSEGRFENSKDYLWSIRTKRLESSDNDEVALRVFKDKEASDTLFSLTTWLKDKK